MEQLSEDETPKRAKKAEPIVKETKVNLWNGKTIHVTSTRDNKRFTKLRYRLNHNRSIWDRVS